MAEIDNGEAIASDLIACKKVLDQANVSWVIMGGVVLGYGRGVGILPWDTDLDIGIFTEVDDVKWQFIVQNLQLQGFRNVMVQQVDFTYCYRESELNLWTFHKNGNHYEAFPSTTPGLKFMEKAIWYDEPQVVEFIGDEYSMPNHITDYLDCRYGMGWENNIVKNHVDYLVYKRGHQSNQNIWPVGRCGEHGPLWPKILKIKEEGL
ncbi:MAG: hypothetical protein H8D23_22690 [Candidatus Brocadiales bacterium]|nr:hypothetical protein [Candidatus Brocadiales bacterium]